MIEVRKGSEVGNKIAASCLEGIAATKESWAAVLGKMASDRLVCSARREASLAKLDASQATSTEVGTSHKVQKEVGKEQPSSNSVKESYIWRAFEALKKGVNGISEWVHEGRQVAHEAKATKFELSARDVREAAAKNRARAAEYRSGTSAVAETMKGEISAEQPTAAQVQEAFDRATRSRKTLDNLENVKFNAPAATELHDRIIAEGPESADANISAAAQEWTARAAGTNATS